MKIKFLTLLIATTLNVFCLQADDWALYGVQGGEFHNGMAKARDGEWGSDSYGNYGYINSSGQVVIPYQYETAGDFFGSVAVVSTKDGPHTRGLINSRGEFVFGPGTYRFTEIQQIPGAHSVYDFERKKKGIFDGNSLVIDVNYYPCYVSDFPFVEYYNDGEEKQYYNLLTQENFLVTIQRKGRAC